MRKSLRLVLALSGASLFGTAFLIACGDDTSVTTNTEAGTTEAGTDARPDTSDPVRDAGADTAPFDGGFVVSTFDTTLATEQCKKLATCCFGTPTPADGGADGGSFDMAACVATFEKIGFQGSNLGSEVKDGGNVVLDQVAADDCISKMKALSCDVSGAEYAAIRAACFGVYSGKFGVGQACVRSVECQKGMYCKGQGLDGSPGACAALGALGDPCGQNPDHPSEYEETCSYRGGANTGNYCKWYENGDLDAGEWKCTAAAGAGSECATSTWCKDTICEPTTFLCKTPDKIYDESCADPRFVK